MPVKKLTRSKASATAKKPATAAATPASQSSVKFRTGAMLVAAMCVTGAVIVIAAHGKTPSARMNATDARPAGSEVVSAQPKPATVDVSTVALPDSTSRPEADAAKDSAANTAPVTIFGCLERSNDTYRLTDTDGADVPKARSWKSAFLKKGAAAVEVVDPGNRAHLRARSAIASA